MATADAPTPLPGRASDADRERFVELLKTRSIEGRLSTETFAYRLERALAARSVPEAAVMTIGRAPDCDCVIAEPSVSRRHASLRRAGERWLLRDLGSSNGTCVNGIRVTDEVEVRPGDQLNLGGVRFRAACRAR
jgi:predicted component of type VI protein secretion system